MKNDKTLLVFSKRLGNQGVLYAIPYRIKDGISDMYFTRDWMSHNWVKFESNGYFYAQVANWERKVYEW